MTLALWPLLMVSTVAQVAPPLTVNGDVLGPAEEFAFTGPGLICLREASIQLAADEKSYLQYSGIHSLKVMLESPRGTLILEEGEAWAKPKGVQRTLFADESRRAIAVRQGDSRRYLLYGKNRYSDGKLVPMIWASGSLLGARPALVLERISIDGSAANDCNIRYNYGWDVLLNGEPIMTRKSSNPR